MVGHTTSFANHPRTPPIEDCIDHRRETTVPAALLPIAESGQSSNYKTERPKSAARNVTNVVRCHLVDIWEAWTTKQANSPMDVVAQAADTPETVDLLASTKLGASAGVLRRCGLRSCLGPHWSGGGRTGQTQVDTQVDKLLIKRERRISLDLL